MDTRDHILGLDLLRFLAATIVALFHFTWTIPETANLAPYGWVGVQIFFVLSGFVIANSAANTTPARFVRSRFMRLYPGAWVALLICGALLLALPAEVWKANGIHVQSGPRHFLNGFTLFSGEAIASAYWTLAVELAFYALVALLLTRGGFRPIPLAAGLTLWSAPYLVVFLLKLQGVLAIGRIDTQYGLLNMTLLRHGPFFALGILLFDARLRGADLRHWLIGIAALGLGCIEIYTRSAELSVHVFATYKMVWPVAGLFWQAVTAFVGGVAIIALSLRAHGHFRLSEPVALQVRRLGLATYPLYLVHEVVGGAILQGLLVQGVARMAAVWAAFAVSCAVAYVIALWLEPKVRTLMRALLDRQTGVLNPAQ